MRIVGYLETAEIKTTVFRHDEKFMVKFETTLFEQTFKFRASEKVNTFKDIEALVDKQFVEEVKERFNEMYESSNSLLGRFLDDHEEDWEEII